MIDGVRLQKFGSGTVVLRTARRSSGPGGSAAETGLDWVLFSGLGGGTGQMEIG